MSTTVPAHAPALIAAHMRAAAGRKPGGKPGPFTVGLDIHTDDPMRNFAVPDEDAQPSAADVAALVAFFRDQQRVPRLEYVEASAPHAADALLAAGFAVERRTPVMVSYPGLELTPREPAGITIREAAGDADLLAAATVQHDAYQAPRPPTADDVARLGNTIRRGGVVSVAVDDASGTVAGSGLVDVPGPGAGTGELAAVAVLTPFRRRGIASALSAYLARTAHSRPVGLVFCEAEPEEEEIYRRTGFTDVSSKIWLSLR